MSRRNERVAEAGSKKAADRLKEQAGLKKNGEGRAGGRNRTAAADIREKQLRIIRAGRPD